MEWDLKALFENVEELDLELQRAKKRAEEFSKKYQNRLKKLKAEEFLKAIKKYEDICLSLSKIMSYAYLEFATDTKKGSFLAKYQKSTTEIFENLLFFELEFNSLDKKNQKTFIAYSKNYSYYLERLKLQKKHQLPLDVERAIMKKELVGASAFSRLFSEHYSRMKFDYRRKKLSEEEVLSLLYDKDRGVRKSAQESLTKGLNEHKELIAFIYNQIKKDQKIDCDLRGYKLPEDSMHIENHISKESVDALVDCVNASTEMVSQYYKTKAKILKLSTLYDYDRYAPISNNEVEYNFEYSKKIVIDALGKFSKTFKDIAIKSFEERWIDVYPKEHKKSGAFSHGTVPTAHPYVLLNHTNRRRDVFTLAHELGHAIHQYLSRGVGYLNSNTPLTTSETASIFAEMLLFDELSSSLDHDERVALYGGKLEDIFATLFRQIVFTNFEREIHSYEDELSSEEISKIWFEKNSEMFGNSIKLTKNYEIWWSYIPHFIQSPFYCYSYAYGQLLVLALFGLYKSGFKDFESKYIEFLSSGGSKSPKELVESFGFDIESVEFWKIGLDEVKRVVDGFVDLSPK